VASGYQSSVVVNVLQRTVSQRQQVCLPAALTTGSRSCSSSPRYELNLLVIQCHSNASWALDFFHAFMRLITLVEGQLASVCSWSLLCRFCLWVVNMLDSHAEGPGFKLQSWCHREQSYANCSHPSCLCSPSSKIGSSPLKGCEGNCRPGGKYWQPTAGFITRVTCRLTAKNWDQLQSPMLGNRVCATVTFTFPLNEHSSLVGCYMWITVTAELNK